jgi:hypothetical protein
MVKGGANPTAKIKPKTIDARYHIQPRREDINDLEVRMMAEHAIQKFIPLTTAARHQYQHS